jgi:hypothetical protein
MIADYHMKNRIVLWKFDQSQYIYLKVLLRSFQCVVYIYNLYKSLDIVVYPPSYTQTCYTTSYYCIKTNPTNFYLQKKTFWYNMYV